MRGVRTGVGPPEATLPSNLFNGQEIWIGNEGIEPEDSPAAYPGAYQGMREALTLIASSVQLPPGSAGTLISYAQDVRTLIPTGPVKALAGPGFGDRRTYYSLIGTALVDGVSAGLTALEAAPQRRRLLLVIGDGNDTDNAAAPARLAQLGERARQHGIAVGAIVYKGALSAEETSVLALAPRAHAVLAQRSIPVELARVMPELLEEATIEFDARALAHDGRPHTLKVVVRGEVIGSAVVTLGAPPDASTSLRWWWIQLAIGLALVGASALLLWQRAGRAAGPVG